MKMTIRFLLLLSSTVFASVVTAQNIHKTDKHKSTAKDTIYIGKHTFIENDRSSVFYKLTTDFSLKDDQNIYNEMINEITDTNKKPLVKHNRKGLPQNWVQMLSYKGKYYPYSHERLGSERFQINDSTTVSYYMDGPTPCRILDINSITKQHYAIIRDGTGVDTINVYIIDDKNKIAVFQEGDRYNLMISANKVNGFPMIVSYNPDGRTRSYRGTDTIDYKKLIEAIKRK